MCIWKLYFEICSSKTIKKTNDQITSVHVCDCLRHAFIVLSSAFCALTPTSDHDRICRVSFCVCFCLALYAVYTEHLSNVANIAFSYIQLFVSVLFLI